MESDASASGRFYSQATPPASKCRPGFSEKSVRFVLGNSPEARPVIIERGQDAFVASDKRKLDLSAPTLAQGDSAARLLDALSCTKSDQGSKVRLEFLQHGVVENEVFAADGEIDFPSVFARDGLGEGF
jgi:hypothetical protein